MIFAIIGGDERQLFLAEALADDGHHVLRWGLEGLGKLSGAASLPLQDCIAESEAVVLPLPVTKDQKTIFAPFSKASILLTTPLASQLMQKQVFGGMTDRLQSCGPVWQKVPIADYYAREELTIGNAYLTAEAALALAIQASKISLNGASCLVTGFGRIGKALCGMLIGMHANVDCAARKHRDFAGIRAIGGHPVGYDEIQRSYDFLFNTVPAKVLTEEVLAHQQEDAVLMELASAPGGIDRMAAKEQGRAIIDAPSLPGRVSPKASGLLIKEAIYNLMGE